MAAGVEGNQRCGFWGQHSARGRVRGERPTGECERAPVHPSRPLRLMLAVSSFLLILLRPSSCCCCVCPSAVAFTLLLCSFIFFCYCPLHLLVFLCASFHLVLSPFLFVFCVWFHAFTTAGEEAQSGSSKVGQTRT